MDPGKRISGILQVELTSPDTERFLRSLNEAGVEVFRLVESDSLTCRFWIKRKDQSLFRDLCERTGSSGKILQKKGIYWTIHRLKRRKLLITGCALLTVALLYLPNRILFVTVSGNHAVPDRRILEAAESCGIYFGASRGAVRSEKVKNVLLSSIPQLQWAGVNTYGCVAEISVREREIREIPKDNFSVRSIVAARDGFVLSATATRGNLLIQPGQTVKEGDVLISGYTDCGISIRAEAAEGEVFAQTDRKIQVVAPLRWNEKQPSGKEKKKISVLFGKKRIFLWKDSGISQGSCGRMYEEYYITLPGGFRLPAALCIERFSPYKPVAVTLNEKAQCSAAEQYARELVGHQMTAGKILQQNVGVRISNGLLVLNGEYICQEMIGRVRQEQIGE